MIDKSSATTGLVIEMAEYQPLISVLIASYNHVDFIQQTIESVWSQAYKNIEIVVVDDFSTDDSRAKLKQLKQQSPLPMKLHFNQNNIGVTATLNVAIEQAQGELIAISGSDDKLAPGRFAAQLYLFKNNPHLKVVFGNCRVLRNKKLAKKVHRERAERLLAMEPQDILCYLYTNKSPLFLQSALIKTSFVKAVGGYDETMFTDDWVLSVRMFERISCKNEFAYIDADVAYYRVHESNAFKNFDRQTRLKLQFVEKYTPNNLKTEAYSNIHFDIAKTALRGQFYKDAWQHYHASQAARFYFGRLGFTFKFLRKLLFQYFALKN